MLLLASASETRLAMLRSAGLDVTAHPSRVDEDSVRASLQAEGAHAHDVADTLAEMKARRLADRFPAARVLGADQVLEFRRDILGKPATIDEAHAQLLALRGQTHRLLSAAVLYDGGQPVWRKVTEARLTMRQVSDAYLDDYVRRNWDRIRYSVGGYRIEEEGIRLFSAIEGDHFTILGLPLLPLLDYLVLRGFIPA